MPSTHGAFALIRRSKALVAFSFITIVIALAIISHDRVRRRAALSFHEVVPEKEEPPVVPDEPKIRYLPEPEWTPPPLKDPWPREWDNELPPIPAWNTPRSDLHEEYDIPYAPPLLIGFSRTYPVLLQAVVSYITAGWPASQIYVIENTGVQNANANDRLTLQNPYYLNHTQLHLLGVNIIPTPVLLSFAQLQNFFLHLSIQHSWPHYFWSHQDILTLSYEAGEAPQTPPARSQGYRTVYELCLSELQRVRQSAAIERIAVRFFAYDHLTLVNRAAYEDVGGWDTFIPYYFTDCDMHTRLTMRNWTLSDAKAGIMTDVSTVLTDLRALYREPGVEVDFMDVNPPPPEVEGEVGTEEQEKEKGEEKESLVERGETEDAEMGYYWKLRKVANRMFAYKHGPRGRNTWQSGGRGGEGEPYFYPGRGIAEAVDTITETGKAVFGKKWGVIDCDLIGRGLKFEDAWKVEIA